MSIYKTAVNRPISTILLFVAAIILGLFSLSKLSIDLMPRIEPNMIIVMTSYDGASAMDIETNITKPLENVLNSVEDLKSLTSTSRDNISVITVEFEWGSDLDNASNNIRDKINLIKATLPDEAKEPTILKFNTDMIPVITLSVEAKESLPALYRILDDQVVNRLNRVEGVGQVSITGAPERVIHVFVDPLKIEAYNLSIEQISQIIRSENLNIPAGKIDIGSETFALRLQGEFLESDQLKKLVIANHNNKPVYLSDVATIEDSVKERSQESYTNGKQGASVSIVKQSGANSVDIAQRVLLALPEIQRTLPSDVKLSVITDTSESIINSINSLTETVMFAFLFVVLVVLYFLGRWRATFIIILTIPVSLIVSFIYLYVTGNTLNIISLSSLSIAIGMVVDDAIVVLENITTHIERGSPPKQAAVYATTEVGISVIASTLTILAVFIPLTMVSGLAGILFKQLGWMVSIICTISTVAALTLTPMLASRMLRVDPNRGKWFSRIYQPIERGLDNLDRFYTRILRWTVHHKSLVIISSIAIFVGSVFMFKYVGTDFFPKTDNGQLGITVELPVSSRVDLSRQVAKNLTDTFLNKYPEIKVINYTVGAADESNLMASMSDNGDNMVSFTIALVNVKDRNRSVFDIAEMMRHDIDNVPDIDNSEVTVGGRRGGGMNTGGSFIDVEVFGYDLAKTDSVAAYMQREFKKLNGARDVLISREEYRPEFHIDLDREKLALNGLNYATVSQYIRSRIYGNTASFFREDGNEYDIVVQYAKEDRKSLEDIHNIMVYNPQGKGIRVAELGDITERFSPPAITHKGKERYLKVSVAIEGVPLNVMATQVNNVIDNMEIPAEIGVGLAGSFQDQQESFADMILLLLLAIILVYIMMASQFESFLYPMIIMLSLPFAFTGVIAALLITGSDLNMISAIGAIMLVGIVVKNGIVLIDYINLNRERGMSVRQSIILGGRSRLRPVLMTTLTTLLGMLPMAIGFGEGSEMWQPMGIAIIGGLTFSTIITLILIPAAYALTGARNIRKIRKKIAKG